MPKSTILTLLSLLLIAFTACQQQPQAESQAQDSTANENMSMDMGMGMSMGDDPSVAFPDSIEGSPRTASMANIGSAHIHIDYSTPAVRDRIIWGGLVPYGQIWVTGAHDATSINFPVDVEIAGQTVPAGKYAFFTIPGETEWTLILNKNWEQHQTRNYSEAEDVLRWTVTPEATEFTSRLTYNVTPTSDNTGRITMRWENVMIGFDVTVI